MKIDWLTTLLYTIKVSRQKSFVASYTRRPSHKNFRKIPHTLLNSCLNSAILNFHMKSFTDMQSNAKLFYLETFIIYSACAWWLQHSPIYELQQPLMLLASINHICHHLWNAPRSSCWHYYHGEHILELDTNILKCASSPRSPCPLLSSLKAIQLLTYWGSISFV